MPGRNCAVIGCGANYCQKYGRLSIFRLPSKRPPKGKTIEEQGQWRDNFLSKITKDRVVDENFRRRIDSGHIYVCERHFQIDDMNLRKFVFKSGIL